MKHSKKSRTDINLKNNIRSLIIGMPKDSVINNTSKSTIICPSLKYIPLESLVSHVYTGPKIYPRGYTYGILEGRILNAIISNNDTNRTKAINIADTFIKGEDIYIMPWMTGTCISKYKDFYYVGSNIVANFRNFKIYVNGDTVVDMLNKRILAYTGIKPEYLSYVIKCKFLNQPINNFALVNVVDESLEVKTEGITKKMYDIIYDNFINTNITGIETLFEDGATLFNQIYSLTISEAFNTRYESAVDEVTATEELQLEMFEQKATIKALEKNNILVHD